MDFKTLMIVIIFASIAISLGFLFIIQKIKIRGQLVWIEKKITLTFIDRVCYTFHDLIEQIESLPVEDETMQKIDKHLIVVYDYIATKKPNLDKANEYLEEKTYIRITDYWDSPYGRILKIGIDKENVSTSLKIKLDQITEKVFQEANSKENKSDKIDTRPNIRIVK